MSGIIDWLFGLEPESERKMCCSGGVDPILMRDYPDEERFDRIIHGAVDDGLISGHNHRAIIQECLLARGKIRG